MSKIEFTIGGTLTRWHDSALVLDGEDAREALVETAIQTIATDVEITVDGVTMHLAGWMDPDHWEDDWQALGIEDVDDLLGAASA